MKQITRPWQATLLASLGAIKLVINTILFFLLLFAKPWLATQLVPLHPNFIVITALQNIVLLPFFLGLILHFFVIRGLWKGQKWSPVFLTILHGVALALSAFWMTGDTHWAIPFSILLFFLALEIECWIHPYFNPKKKFSLLGFLKLLKK